MVFQRQEQGGIIADQEGSGKDLRVGGQFGDVEGAAPAVVTDGKQNVAAFVVQGHAAQGDQRVGVRDVEHVSAQAGQAAAGHREGGGAAVRVTAHGLVDHDRVQEGGVAVAGRVAGGQVTVFQGDGVLSLDAHALGQVGDQDCVLHGDVRGGIDRGGPEAIRGIGAAVHIDGAAATVGTDGRGGTSGGGHGQVFGIGDAAAGGHDTAGTVTRGGDHRAGNMQGGAVAFRAVAAAVAAVAEDAVGAGGGGFNRSAGDDHVRPVLQQDRRVQAVEVAVVPAVGIPGLGDRGIVQGHACLGDHQSVFVRGRGSIGFTGPCFETGIGIDLFSCAVGKGGGTASGRRSTAEAAASGRIPGRIAAAETVRRITGRVAAAEALRRFAGRRTAGAFRESAKGREQQCGGQKYR